MKSFTRRDFLRTTTAAAAAGPLILRASAHGAGPNDRITLGVIGVGTMGRGHLGAFLGMNDVQIVAVCDVVAERRDDARKRVNDRYSKQAKGNFKGCDAYTDLRQIIERKDIDAVVIATPDHWHTVPCILAARAKKDIYCEKPLTHHIAEGQAIVKAVRDNKVVFQTGSQQRNEFGGKFRYAAELIHAGRIGKIQTVRVGVGGSPKPCDLPDQTAPEGTDWDIWLGPAPKRAYSDVLCPRGIHNHFPAWRNYSEYAGGGLADMGAHHFDIAQWALGMDGTGPTTIEPPAKGGSGLKFTYANGVVMYHGGPTDCTFEGADGTINVSRGHFDIKPKDLIKEKDAVQMKNRSHHRDWIDAIRSRKDPACPAEVGHRSASICHLANIGYLLRRKLAWDPKAERFVSDDEANRLLVREARAGWWKI